MTLKKLLFLTVIIIFSSCEKKSDSLPLMSDFNEPINFTALTPQNILFAVDSTLVLCDQIVDDLLAVGESERTFNNTLLKIDDLEATLMRPANPLYLMGSVHPDQDIRRVADSAVIMLQQYNNNLKMNAGIYKALKIFSASSEAKSLTGWQKKFLDDQLRLYKRNGLDLPKSKRAQIKSLRNLLDQRMMQFYNNISSYSDTLFVTEDEIIGLPDNYKNERKTADGRYAIDLSYPSYLPFMKLSESSNSRRRLLEKYLNRSKKENLPLLRVILRERKKLANLLGYHSYAAFSFEENMVKTTEVVYEFENDLLAAIQTKIEKEMDLLLELKTRKTRRPAKQIFQWEKYYYMDQLAKTRYKLDAEEVREYFEVGNVIDGLLTSMQDLFELRFVQVEDARVWHKDVLLYQAYDNETNDWIGSFYLDLFPRANKFSHAACFDVVEGKAYPTDYQKPVFALVCNFPKSSPEIPSLLTHDQVLTFFHEFGHGLHNLLTKSPIILYSGTRVEQDFVETPSQVYEEWVWDKAVLNKFALHYKTGEPIPDNLLKKMLAAKNMLSGINTAQQIYYGLLALTLHDNYNPFGLEKTTEIVAKLQNELTPFPYMPDTYFEASFGYLMGYGAGYYGYLWSKVYAQDILSIFKQNGIMDRETTRKYRTAILEKGGTANAAELLFDFLGREPDNQAFIRSLGL